MFWRNETGFRGTSLGGLPPWASHRSKVAPTHPCLDQGSQPDPFEGSGKPEPLRHALSGFWSRRIDEEHRMIYKVDGDSLLIAQLRYHY
jgi:toxin YoeB